MAFSRRIGAHTESDDPFIRDLYRELVSRLREMRDQPEQAEPSNWRAWIVPFASCLVIAIIFFAYLYPQF